MNIREQLELYKARAEELRHTYLIRRCFNPSITIKWDRMQGLRFESKEPNEEHLRSFLITFRQFISNEEPVFLYRIHNLCQQYLTSDELKGYLVTARKAWKETQKNTGLKLIFSGHELTPEYVTDLWINGFYFHNDQKKRSILKSLLPHERMFVRNQFLNFLMEGTRQVLYLSNIITYALKEDLFKPKD